MDVFEAFPNALEEWNIGEVNYGTMRGTIIVRTSKIRVIVDKGTSGDQTNAPGAATIASDTLLYVVPADLPTTDTSELVTDYIITDPKGRDYEILDAGEGKNQHTGRLEHIELKLRPTEAIREESE
jgi:hypothetical protein